MRCGTNDMFTLRARALTQLPGPNNICCGPVGPRGSQHLPVGSRRGQADCDNICMPGTQAKWPGTGGLNFSPSRLDQEKP